MEYIDIYDLNGNMTGRKIPRDYDYSKLAADERLLIVHVCIFNSRREMLLQHRVLTKDRYPGLWDVSAGGFAMSGEDSEGAVKRELREELGIEPESTGMHFVCREPFSIVFDDFYAIFSDPDPAQLKLQREEVSECAWFSESETMAMLSDGRLVDYPEELMKRLFEYAENTAKE